MSKIICRACTEEKCDGCNMYILSEALNEGELKDYMDAHGMILPGLFGKTNYEQCAWDTLMYEQGTWDTFIHITSAWYGDVHYRRVYTTESPDKLIVISRYGKKFKTIREAIFAFVDEVERWRGTV